MDPMGSIVGTLLATATVYGVARAVGKLGRSSPLPPAVLRPRAKKLSRGRRVTAREVLGTR